ncbi:hypothetical protein [Nonomuraea dietziae]|uniref:hypothetical protein n=1 Tax=Nonomuraea dietziae TaxID=65515 RepID=UPI0031CE931B
MFDRFTDPARRAVMRAGILTMNAGRTSLATDLLLLGLAEEHPMPHLPDPAALRPHIDTGRTRELLAAIGIDVEEVRRRTRHGLDDPRLWRLERSRVAFLRVTLSGPMGVLPLRMHARKAIEVALWKPGPVTGERLLWGACSPTPPTAAQPSCARRAPTCANSCGWPGSPSTAPPQDEHLGRCSS